MNASDWEKITKNWTKLTAVIDYELLPRLFQKRVLTLEEKEYFRELKGMKRQNMEALYTCLKSKPPETEAFECLMQCLAETEIHDYISLAQDVRNTKTTADPSLVCKVDRSYSEDDVREILSTHFMNKTGTEVMLSRVRKVINESGGFSQGFEWSNKQLGGFLCQHFGDVNIVKRKERLGMKNVTREYVQNLCEILQQETQMKRDLSSGFTKDDFDIKEAHPSDLKTFLQNQLKKLRLPLEPLDVLEKEEISGNVFLTLTESDLEKLIPAPLGVRRAISMIINDYKESTSSNISRLQQAREFDVDVDSGDFYTLGRCVGIVSHARGKRTSRIKNFHSLMTNATDDDKIEYTAVEVVLFAAACINERRNGTIYFGIHPETTQRHRAGEVCGVMVIKEDLQREVDFLLDKAFHEHHKTTIQCTVRPAKFIPVHYEWEYRAAAKTRDPGEKCVIEYDIVPDSDILKEETFRIKLNKIPHLHKKHKVSECVVRFSDKGKPKILNEKESYAFEADKMKICSQRKTDENTKHRKPPYNLRQMLQNLLTAGHTVIEDDIFVVLGPVGDMEREAVLSNVSFLKNLYPEVIFDFDGNGSSDGIYHSLEDDENLVTRVLTVDNFKVKRSERKKIDELALSLRKEKHTCWIFCNGYDELQMLPLQSSTEWNKTRRNAFGVAVESFLDFVHNDNVLVLICLFGTNNEIVLEASEELFLKLPNQWILLAENDKAATAWKQTLLDRNRIDKHDVEGRCIVGMAWSQMNRCISDWCNKNKVLNVQIPQSDGNHINIAEKTIRTWSDIEVVSCSDPVFEDSKEEKFIQKGKRLEEEFYRGAQVNWFNFWYHDQVLVRDMHESLRDNVESALEMQRKDEEVKIIPVYLHHQPGAGGTTSAKQVLWCLRKKYRCCVVKDITGQTCVHLRDFYLYEDKNPKPILVLLDNEDEDKFETLRNELDQVTHDLQKEMQEELNVFCVLLILVRCADVSPAKRNSKMNFLKHELHSRELAWFRKKSKELETRFTNDGRTNVNPKFLISFNILKENFNQEYITKVVKEFTDEISSRDELRLLKYVSLLNAHDVNFTSIPVACITRLLRTSTKICEDDPFKTKMAAAWEQNMSQGLKVLLNVSSKKRRHIPKTVRVFHKLIAIEILKHIKTVSGQSESEMMFELLESVFEDGDRDSREMQRIVTNVIRKRPYKDDKPSKREPFSSLILSVMKNEGDEKAIEILKSLHNFDHDPFTAQQIARSYIEMKNFSEAERFAKYATDKLPSNSYLWDTYGQVYKNQLVDKVDFQKSLVKSSDFTEQDVTQSFELFREAVFYFKREQFVSGEEMNVYQGKDNFAGYFNELRCILLLLGCLENCGIFSSRENFHRYLVSENLYLRNETLHRLLDEEQRKCIKSLYSSSKQIIQKLEEETLQRKSKYPPGMFETFEEESFFRDYTFLKRSLDEYFGESADTAQPIRLSEEELCKYRYRQARTKGATSLQALLDCARNERSEDLFKNLYDTLFLNVTGKFCCSEYLRAILDVVVMLCIKGEISDLSFPDILSWSRQLYVAEHDDERNPALEKYLYFMLFHFPTEERKGYAIGSSFELSRAIKQWESAYDMKYHKNGRKTGARRKETTQFFLGRGNPLNDLVYQEFLPDTMASYSRSKKWYLPEVVNLLRPMNGTLLEGGRAIKYFFQTSEGNRQFLTIRTSIQVRQRNWWQKNVFFFVGFSFSGPKAYGISDEKTSETSDEKSSSPRAPISMKPRRDHISRSITSLTELQAREADLTEKIRKSKSRNSRQGSNFNDGNGQRLQQLLDEIQQQIKRHLSGEH